ncbi:efflux RND transporter permease subunit [Novipirellula artificiosorum]|uniref:Putative efflux pump membrane transporter TtgB n=1 Tax=Novipirellula artificiosorum TaxID=2528016 RepID=A0A5C6D257_9BACT|nr:efflux RND transporter permease subunit [Novipirellula artificiosorum]TWU30818.1 putative efflux pump membrane transporter TtgB [Novipirellula artificiosorum]
MISHFFIDRPIFASVLSIVIVIFGGVAVSQLPVAQYPDVTPPTVQVTATYPGANAVTVAETVATPIEQEVNGVERMLYMSSKCTNDGQMMLDVTFELGTNLDTAQVLVQNRVAVAEAKLPEDVKRIGVTTKKKSASILMCVNLISPGGRYDQLYLSNFALLNVKDDLARVSGVGDVSFLGPRDYSMRIWLDPNKLASLQMTASDVIQAIQEQNVQVAAGRIGQPPIPTGANVPFQLPLNVQGRLSNEEQFEEIVVKRGERGQMVYLRDVVREKTYDDAGRVVEKGIELGAKNYDVNSYLDGEPSVTLGVFQLPGSNALETAASIREKMAELKTRFPEGVKYKIEYDTTVFVSESITSVYHTLIEAFVLVFIVVLVFLQNWRATIIPMVAVPVSLIGTFAFMALFGFSLNNLSLFGLVLAIGIVVDDAIVVVENVERLMATGLKPRDACRKAMEEVTGPVIAISLVLCAVFVPTAFMAGISGQFFKQFALTIAASTVISAFNSLTLSPALCALLLKPHDKGDGAHGHASSEREALPRLGIAILGGLIAYVFLSGLVAHWTGLDIQAAKGHGPTAPDWLRIALFFVGSVAGWFLSHPVNWVLNRFFDGFNWGFDVTIRGYGRCVSLMLRTFVIVLGVYCVMMFLTFLGFKIVPAGFIPEQDKGYLVVNAQLPDGASLERSDQLVRKLSKIARETEGVAHTIDLAGYSTLLNTNISNAAGMFVVLSPFEERAGKPELAAPAVIARLRQKFSEFQEAQTAVFGAPPVEGLGSTGGFKLQIQDRRGAGLRALQGAVQNMADESRNQPGLVGVFSTFSVSQPQLYAEIDREKVKSQNVSLDEVHLALQTFLGSAYVNDFSFQNRNWQVNVQADPRYRMRAEDIGKLEVRNADGNRVPLATLLKVENTSGPPIVNHYNLYPSAELNGATAPGVSSSQAITMMEDLADSSLPTTMGYEWTELTYQQILASKDILTKLAFPLGVLFIFLVLAAQYESWLLPLAIILIVPMCILAALTGVWLAHLDNNIFVQIGLIVLIGLAAKNAILIVEFAKQLEDSGQPRFEATVDACRLRLRPILMTSFAFILGVVPLVLAKGAGAEMRFTLGLAVFSGMLGVTIFGIFFTPVFYYVVRWMSAKQKVEKLESQPVEPVATSLTVHMDDQDEQDHS